MKRIFLFMACLAALSGLRAQTPDSTQAAGVNPYQRIVELQDQIAALKAEVADSTTTLNNRWANINRVLEKRIKVLRDSVANLQKKLDNEQNSNNRKQRDLLQAECDRYKSKLDSVQQENSNLQQQLNDLREQLQAQYQQKHEADSVARANAEAEAEALKQFRGEFLASLADGVEAKWLDRPYADINLIELKDELKRYEEYADQDARVAAAAKKLSAFLAECEVYAEGRRVVESPFVAGDVASAQKTVTQLLNATGHPGHRQELKDLFYMLDNYAATVEEFQDLIREIQSNTAAVSDSGLAWNLAKVVIGAFEDNGTVGDIQKIPWLAAQYKQYRKALIADGKNPDYDVNNILKLQP